MLLNYQDKIRMKRRQAGMTTLGLIILVAFVGLFAFAGIRLTPIYLNYMKVVSIVESVREEFDGAGASRSDINQSIRRRFDIESVSEITAREVKITSVDGGFEVSATYSHKAPFIANVFFLVDFDKRAVIRR
jgi:hypothetical protein